MITQSQCLCQRCWQMFIAPLAQLVGKQEGFDVDLGGHTAAHELDTVFQEGQGVLILFIVESKPGFVELVFAVRLGNALVALRPEAAVLGVKSADLMCQRVVVKNIEAIIHLINEETKTLMCRCLQKFNANSKVVLYCSTYKIVHYLGRTSPPLDRLKALGHNSQFGDKWQQSTEDQECSQGNNREDHRSLNETITVAGVWVSQGHGGRGKYWLMLTLRVDNLRQCFCQLSRYALEAPLAELVGKQEGFDIGLGGHAAANELDVVLQEGQGVLFLMIAESKSGVVVLVVAVNPGHALVALRFQAVVLGVKSSKLVSQRVVDMSVGATSHFNH